MNHDVNQKNNLENARSAARLKAKQIGKMKEKTNDCAELTKRIKKEIMNWNDILLEKFHDYKIQTGIEYDNLAEGMDKLFAKEDMVIRSALKGDEEKVYYFEKWFTYWLRNIDNNYVVFGNVIIDRFFIEADVNFNTRRLEYINANFTAVNTVLYDRLKNYLTLEEDSKSILSSLFEKIQNIEQLIIFNASKGDDENLSRLDLLFRAELNNVTRNLLTNGYAKETISAIHFVERILNISF